MCDYHGRSYNTDSFFILVPISLCASIYGEWQYTYLGTIKTWRVSFYSIKSLPGNMEALLQCLLDSLSGPSAVNN